jgi:hypothetical protein
MIDSNDARWKPQTHILAHSHNYCCHGNATVPSLLIFVDKYVTILHAHAHTHIYIYIYVCVCVCLCCCCCLTCKCNSWFPLHCCRATKYFGLLLTIINLNNMIMLYSHIISPTHYIATYGLSYCTVIINPIAYMAPFKKNIERKLCILIFSTHFV